MNTAASFIKKQECTASMTHKLKKAGLKTIGKATVSASLVALYLIAWWALENKALPLMRQWCENSDSHVARTFVESMTGFVFHSCFVPAMLASVAIAGAILAIGLYASGRERAGRWSVRFSRALPTASFAFAIVMQCVVLEPASSSGKLSIADVLCIAVTLAVVIIATIGIIRRSNRRGSSFATYVALSGVAAMGPIGIALGLAVVLAVGAVMAVVVLVALLPILLPLFGAVARTV